MGVAGERSILVASIGQSEAEVRQAAEIVRSLGDDVAPKADRIGVNGVPPCGPRRERSGDEGRGASERAWSKMRLQRLDCPVEPECDQHREWRESSICAVGERDIHDRGDARRWGENQQRRSHQKAQAGMPDDEPEEGRTAGERSHHHQCDTGGPIFHRPSLIDAQIERQEELTKVVENHAWLGQGIFEDTYPIRTEQAAARVVLPKDVHEEAAEPQRADRREMKKFPFIP